MTHNPPPPASPGPSYPGGSPSAWQPQKNFFGALFDFGFDRFVTPSIIRIVYVLGLVAIALSYLAYVIFAFGTDAALGLIVLLFGWIPALLYLAFWRVILEFFLAVIRMSEDIHHRLPGSGP